MLIINHIKAFCKCKRIISGVIKIYHFEELALKHNQVFKKSKKLQLEGEVHELFQKFTVAFKYIAYFCAFIVPI